MRYTLLILACLLLGGCCTYKGKFVSRSTAERMANMGMDVHCPGEARIVEGHYVAPLFPPANSCDRRRGRWGLRRYGKL